MMFVPSRFQIITVGPAGEGNFSCTEDLDPRQHEKE